MKVAGILSLALAVSASLPHVGQTADDAPLSPPSLAPGGPQPVYGTPSLTAPEEIEGAWVSDPKPAAAPARQAAMPMAPGQMMPNPMMNRQYKYDPYAEKAAAIYGGYPEQYVGSPESQYLSGDPGDPYAGYDAGGAGQGGGEYGGGEYGGDCSGEGCGYGECDGGGCRGCGFGGCPVSLWDEVHAHHRFYLREEYISWWTKGNPLPPLATTSPLGTLQDEAGVLGVDGTQVLIGNERANETQRSGGRITAGMWLVDGEFLGIEGHYMGLEQSVENFHESGEFSNGGDGPILARPFFNVETDAQDGALLAFPDFDNNGTITQLDGSISVRSKVATHSAGLLLRKLMWIEFTNCWRVEGLAGYRFFRLDDGVRIEDSWTEFGGPFGTASFASYDYFQAQNQFHGGELGLVGTAYRGNWSFEATGKVALGNMHQHVKIDGTSFVNVLGTTVETGNFRLLTQPTNDGIYRNDQFAVLPEFNFNVRYNLTCNLRLLAGYNLIYVSDVQRSGSAIDLRVNPTQIGGQLVGPALPKFSFHDEDFWMHGLNLGIELRY